jgi:vitamin K-dependent gamma-carboxylase
MSPPVSPSASLAARLFRPVDIGWLVLFRLAFGGIMLWEVTRYLSKGWVERYYVEPVFHFTYFGFDWVRPWDGEGMQVHFYALGVLAFCILIGLCYRLAAALFFLGFSYVFLLDQTHYLNHFYLVCLVAFLLIFIPAHRAFSVDALLRPQLRADAVPAWTLWLLRAQIGIPYFFGGIAKLNGDWLRGEPMRMWLAARTDFPGIGQWFREEWMVYAFTYGGLLLDLLVVPALMWRRTRVPAFLAAVSFHLLNARLFSIGIFPWFMLCATLIFFPHDLPRRVWNRIMRRPAPAGAAAVGPASGRRLTLWLLGIYMAVQLLLPWRHLLYPGNVNWTEEGHRFAWHMKLRGKDAEALFLVSDPVSHEVEPVHPLKYLTPRQTIKMAARPDMILQFAHFLQREMAVRGRPGVQVRARVTASLNGRQPQLLIDPDVDLAREPRTLWHARWIVPLTAPLSQGAAERPRGEDTE